jgi:hypothetical protein
MPGELWIGGEGLTFTSHHRLDLTREKLLDNPFGNGLVYRCRSPFKLGDRSLRAMELIAGLDDRCGVTINLPTLFRAHHFESCLNTSKGQESILHFSDKEHYSLIDLFPFDRL